VFMTLRLSIVALIMCLLVMLYAIEDEGLRFHLKIFLAMAVVLLVLIIWFIGELRAAQAEQAAKSEKAD